MSTSSWSLSSLPRREAIGFWLMGLLNNSSFVIMISGAKTISEGGTAFVFIMNTLPSLIIKMSAPYWFHLVTYQKRFLITSILFSLSFFVVGYFCSSSRSSSSNAMWGALIGVGLSSIGSGLGESSLLALAGRYENMEKNRQRGKY